MNEINFMGYEFSNYVMGDDLVAAYWKIQDLEFHPTQEQGGDHYGKFCDCQPFVLTSDMFPEGYEVSEYDGELCYFQFGIA